MCFDPQARTGLAFVSLRADGEREFVFFRNPSADMLLRPEEIPDTALDGCRVYHFGSISLIQDPSRAATLAVLERARANGAWISFDPNLRERLWPDLETARRIILEALPLADVVKLSEEEAVFLFGPGSPGAHARRIIDLGAQVAAVTLGASGVHLLAAEGTVSVRGFQVEAVDCTGAGDGFMAGLLAGLLQHGEPSRLGLREMFELARCANAVGALTCTRKGAIPALPNRGAVEEFLRSETKSAAPPSE
jgi:fructokinase